MAKLNVTPGAINQDRTPAATVGSPSLQTVVPVLLQANEPIVSGRLVANILNKAYKYDVANPAHKHMLVGIALNSSDPGQVSLIQPSGMVYIPGWGLTPGQIYRAGLNGQLVTTKPAGSKFSQVIGRAVTADQLQMDLQPVITV